MPSTTFYNEINHTLFDLDCTGDSKEFESDKHRDTWMRLHFKKCKICREAEAKRKLLRIPQTQDSTLTVIWH